MALTSKAQFEKYVPVNAGFTDGVAIDTFLQQAEDNYLVPLIGKDFYDELVSLGNVTDARKLNVLTHLYRAVSYTALWLYIPFGNVQISQSGIQIVSDNNRKSAFDWQVNQVSNATAAMGMDGFELLLEALESNINDWETYKNSDNRKANSKYFISSATQFNEVYNINRSRLTFLCLVPLISEVEDRLIIPTLGNYYPILKQKAENDLTAQDKELLKAIRRAIAYSVIGSAISTHSIDISTLGFSVNFLPQFKNTKATLPASDARLDSLQSLAKERSADYLAQIPTLLPGYTPPSNQIYNINNGDNSIVSFF